MFGFEHGPSQEIDTAKPSQRSERCPMPNFLSRPSATRPGKRGQFALLCSHLSKWHHKLSQIWRGTSNRQKPGVFFKGNICGFRVPNFLLELRILSWFSLVMKKSTMYSTCRWLKHRTWKVLRLPGLPGLVHAGAMIVRLPIAFDDSLPKHIVSLCKFSIANCKLPECNLKGKHCMIQCASLISFLWTVSKTIFVR